MGRHRLLDQPTGRRRLGERPTGRHRAHPDEHSLHPVLATLVAGTLLAGGGAAFALTPEEIPPQPHPIIPAPLAAPVITPPVSTTPPDPTPTTAAFDAAAAAAQAIRTTPTATTTPSPPPTSTTTEPPPPPEPEPVAQAQAQLAMCEDSGWGVKPHVAEVGHHIATRFGLDVDNILGRGSRSISSSDHPRGLALDFMVGSDRATGDEIADYVLAHQGEFGVKYVIWLQRYNDGSGWDPMEDRGGTTANHMDHVHVSLLADVNVEVAC